MDEYVARKWKPHDLIEIRVSDINCFDREIPHWATQFLSETPWVVVRRGNDHGKIPVGIRGYNKNQKFACYLKKEAAVRIFTPQEVMERYIEAVSDSEKADSGNFAFWQPKTARRLKEIRNHFCKDIPEGVIRNMGIGGSIGFEIASGKKISTSASDLDLIIVLDDRVKQKYSCNYCNIIYSECFRLYEELKTLGVKTDAVLETVHGWIALEEYVRSPHYFLIKSPDGSCKLGKEL